MPRPRNAQDLQASIESGGTGWLVWNWNGTLDYCTLHVPFQFLLGLRLAMLCFMQEIQTGKYTVVISVRSPCRCEPSARIILVPEVVS